MPMLPTPGLDASTPFDRDRSVLVLVDYQARLMPAIADAARVVDNALFVARVAQRLGVPVIGTEQNPLGLGANLDAVRALCGATMAKMHFDATGDGLLERLREARPSCDRVIVAGCEAHVCLMQTVLGLRRAGLPVAVVADACGSRRAADHALAMQRLAGAGAVIVGTEMLAFEWLRSCRDDAFRDVLALVKARG